MRSLGSLRRKMVNFNNLRYIIVFSFSIFLSCYKSRLKGAILFIFLLSLHPILFNTTILVLVPLVLNSNEVWLRSVLCRHDLIGNLIDHRLKGVVHFFCFFLLLDFSLSFLNSPLLPLLDFLKSFIEGQSLVFRWHSLGPRVYRWLVLSLFKFLFLMFHLKPF